MRSGQIVLHGLGKDLTDKELERAYFGFHDGGQTEEMVHSEGLTLAFAGTGNGSRPS